MFGQSLDMTGAAMINLFGLFGLQWPRVPSFGLLLEQGSTLEPVC